MGQRLTDTEALMWSLGHDPNLANTMGLVAVLDGKPDPERFRITMANAVAGMERLRQRVHDASSRRSAIMGTSPNGRLEWVTDSEFDFDHHVRIVRLTGKKSGPATDADLRLAAAQFINDPFDTARPPWQFQLVTGLTKGRSALLGKVHHSISDGIGLLRLAASLLEFEPETEPPIAIDLTSLMDKEASAEVETDESADAKSTPERLLGWLQNAAQGVATPGQVIEVGTEVLASAKALSDQLPKAGASELWAARSRNRRLEFLSLPLHSLKGRAGDLDVTINDLFVAACSQAAVHYHAHLEADLNTISATVVVSTKPSGAHGDLGGEGDNAFIPVAITLPGKGATALDRLLLIKGEVRKRREALAKRGDVLSTISTLGSLVPSSLAASMARDQAAKVDFATSNIPGPPIPTWFSGQPVKQILPVGPVAGTAFNVTLMTSDQTASLGIHLDPAAIEHPDLLLRSLRDGFGDFKVARR